MAWVGEGTLRIIPIAMEFVWNKLNELLLGLFFSFAGTEHLFAIQVTTQV